MVEETLIQGGIYLARLDPAKSMEIGKIRPVVVLMNNAFLAVTPTILICPLSSQSHVHFHSLHPKIYARDNLLQESFALIEHCRAISRNLVMLPRLAQLTEIELITIREKINILIA
jgi:mRNA interferase MazF